MTVSTCVKIPCSLIISWLSDKRLKKYGKVSVDRYTSSFYPRVWPRVPLSLSAVPDISKGYSRHRHRPEREGGDSYWKWLESRAISCARVVTVDTRTLVPLSSYAQWSPEKYKSRIEPNLCSSFSIHNNHWVVSFGSREQQHSWQLVSL